MRKGFFVFIILLAFNYSQGQNKIERETTAIVEEGKKLYRLEMTSWYGTDVFFEKFSERKGNIGGYFSYADRDIFKCIFFSKGENPIVIGTISLDSTFNVDLAIADGVERNFTNLEKDLYVLQKMTIAEIYADTLFKSYENTNYNLILLMEKRENKVYVLTGPKTNGVVIFGNDYLLKFDKKNKLISKKSLHRNILPFEYAKEEDEAVTIHSHTPETGGHITATDICTLMLYGRFAKWTQHIVVSNDYISIWDCKKNKLGTLTKEAWDRYNASQELEKKE